MTYFQKILKTMGVTTNVQSDKKTMERVQVTYSINGGVLKRCSYRSENPQKDNTGSKKTDSNS